MSPHDTPADPAPPRATVYGLPGCDTCRKARHWLERFGIAHAFIDYRAERQPPELLKAWAGQLGGWEKLVNKASTTWRQLPEARKTPGSDPEWTLLLKEHPALIRRPLLVTADGVVTVGFSDNAYKARFGVKK
jgi:Spx/MgsR family transcriptional regulator